MAAHPAVDHPAAVADGMGSPVSAADQGGAVERPLHILTLSARTEKALAESTRRHEAHLAAHTSQPIADVCHTANCGRFHGDHRLAVVVGSSREARERLGQDRDGEPHPGIFRGGPRGRTRPRIAFLFTGQGAQYAGMGRALYQTQPVFSKALDQCDEILGLDLGEPLLEVLYGGIGREEAPPGVGSSFGDDQLQQTIYAQPALFALEYALGRLWASWGIEPDVVMGHSAGEYAAACLAGVFSLEDGLRLIAARGRLMQSLPADGRMAAVLAPEDEVRSAIARSGLPVSIAALNGPRNTVVSGDWQAVSDLLAALEARDIPSKPLDSPIAFHSPRMATILPEFERAAAGITYRMPQIPLIANVTGNEAGAEIMRPSYWAEHIVRPVRFAEGIAELHRRGIDSFVEVGPRPTLLRMAQECPDRERTGRTPASWVTSLRPGRSDWEQLLESLARLYVQRNAGRLDRIRSTLQEMQGRPPHLSLPARGPLDRDGLAHPAREDCQRGGSERACAPIARDADPLRRVEESGVGV